MRFGTLPLVAPLALVIALFWASPALSTAIPRETIDRLVQITVEKAEIEHLNAVGKLNDQEYKTRRNALTAEQEILSKPLTLMLVDPPERAAEITEAQTAITGQTRAKLSLLEPKWAKEAAAYRAAGEKRRSDMMQDVVRSAQQGAKIQKQRQELHAQLEKGTIDRPTFDRKDAEALAAIQALRNKNDPQGRAGYYFDERLTFYTSRMNDPPPKPAPPPPLPRIPEPRTFTPKPFSFWDLFSGGTLVLLIWVAAGIVMVAAIIMNALRKPPSPDPIPDPTDIHGSAQWHPVEWITGDKDRVSRGVHFGKSSTPEWKDGFSTPTIPITSQPENHVLIIAKAGAGKGTRVIMPTLARYASAMCIVDPKGENAAVTARTRRDQLGQDIQILNPWGVLKSHYAKMGFHTATYNPLDVLDRNDPNITSLARSLAQTISPVTDPKGEFWQRMAARILTGTFLWLTDQEGLPRYDDPKQPETKTLARVAELVNLPKPEFQKFLARLQASKAFNGDIRQQVGQMGDSSAADTYGGIMLHLQGRTDFIDSAVKISTATSSISFAKLADGSLTVYLVIPFDYIKTHGTWLRLIISAATQAITAAIQQHPEKPHHRCMFLIDEFGSIGYIPAIASDLAQLRGYGVDFTLILQDLGQLKDHYKEARNSILANCGYKYFCWVKDLESAKYLSESLGKKTVQTIGKSKSSGTSQSGQTEGDSITYGETGRNLLNPDEIMTLNRDVAILLQPTGAPHYLHTIDHWNLTNAYAFLKGMEPQFYWEPPLRLDDNPYHKPPKPPNTITPTKLLKKPNNAQPPEPPDAPTVESIKSDITKMLGWGEEYRRIAFQRQPKPKIDVIGEEVFTEEDFIDPPKKPPKPPPPKNPTGSIGEDVF